MPTTAFFSLLQRDLLLAVRSPGEIINPVLFFVVVVALFPLSLEPDPELLRRLGPGVIWVGALLASLLSLDALFRSDFEDGSVDLMLVSPQPLPLLVAAKLVAHWLLSGLPLILISPLLGLMLNLPQHALGVLLLSLLLGTPVLTAIGAIGVGLTVGLRRGGILLSLLVMPLYVPTLIFGAGAIDHASAGLPYDAALWYLAALLSLGITLAPLATAAALRISAE